MKCTSCLVEIPPTFLAAIRSGVCPSCNGQIMPPESKQIYDDIRLKMSQMPNDPDGLAGWLLSNYYLDKIDPEKEVEAAKFYYPKQKTPKSKSQSKKLNKMQKFYAQDFDPAADLEDDEEDEEEFNTADNPFFQQAGLTRSQSETQALIKKAKKGGNDEWDPQVLNAIVSMKPEADNEFSTYEEEIDYPLSSQTPKNPKDVLKQNLMRQNKSRAALDSHDPRGFRRSS